MKKLLISIFGRNMAVLALLTSIFAFFVHGSFVTWVNNPEFLSGSLSVQNLLMVIMFGMGLTLSFKDFIFVFKHPASIIAGELAQFIIMPLAGFVLCCIFRLPTELAAGVILVGCCPGGTASNVITYMAKGDVALSIGMTAVSTLLAPIITPLATWFYMSLYQDVQTAEISIDAFAMFLSIIKIIVVPVFLGLIINAFFEKITKHVSSFLPVISSIAICMIIGFVIDANHEKLFKYGFVIITVVILHNLTGYLFGYLAGKLLKLEAGQSSAITIEVGMQNSGLAASLANTCFPSLALATVPGALFSAWHNISGAIVAGILRRTAKKTAGDKQ